jgi:putative ABC transport system permease protein
MLSVFGAIGVFVAAMGIYGVLAFVIAHQVREIGLRMALGASARSVIAGVLGKALRFCPDRRGARFDWRPRRLPDV